MQRCTVGNGGLAIVRCGKIGGVEMICAIANVHQFCGKDRTNPVGEAVDYPERQLIGLTKKGYGDLLEALSSNLLS